jgi:membrane protein YqaA with SNARE-associated domain
VKITKSYSLKIFVAILVITLAFWLAHLARESSFIQEMVAAYGYLGILVVSFASGFNLLVPIPAVSFLPLYAEAGLSVPVTVTLITIGVTVADSVAYLIGRLGREVAAEIDHNRVVAFFDRIQIKHKTAPLVVIYLFASLAPLPNEILVIPLGLMRFRFSTLFPLLLAGNATFNTLTALGLLHIFDFFS